MLLKNTHRLPPRGTQTIVLKNTQRRPPRGTQRIVLQNTQRLPPRGTQRILLENTQTASADRYQGFQELQTYFSVPYRDCNCTYMFHALSKIKGNSPSTPHPPTPVPSPRNSAIPPPPPTPLHRPKVEVHKAGSTQQTVSGRQSTQQPTSNSFPHRYVHLLFVTLHFPAVGSFGRRN